MITITWLAHSCFMITNQAGKSLLMDPYNEETGYDVNKVKADVVTTSHKHGDHANLAMVEGDYTLIDTVGAHAADGFAIEGIASKHDDQNGSQRGDNIIFVVKTDGVRLCHLGDLGHRLSAEQIDKIGKIDILMIPVGGNYTIGANTAAEVADSLQPLLVLPMHYKTDVCTYPIDSEQGFVERMQQAEYAIIMHHAPVREYDPNDPPKRHAVVVMDHLN